MASVYECLISHLKNELKNKNIKFKDLFILINNKEYDKIIKIINDETIQNLIDNIVAERKKIGNNMEKKLNDLVWLNERLIQFGEEPQLSKTKALNLLKTKVFINIYDLESGQYEKRTTLTLLKKELKNKPERRFPLKVAKKYITLKCFLIKC
jgi:hypothetical protein